MPFRERPVRAYCLLLIVATAVAACGNRRSCPASPPLAGLQSWTLRGGVTERALTPSIPIESWTEIVEGELRVRVPSAWRPRRITLHHGEPAWMFEATSGAFMVELLGRARWAGDPNWTWDSVTESEYVYRRQVEGHRMVIYERAQPGIAEEPHIISITDCGLVFLFLQDGAKLSDDMLIAAASAQCCK